MVHMEPGSEMVVPERTETSSGFSGEPRRRPVCSSSCPRCRPTASLKAWRSAVSLKSSAQMGRPRMKAGGTRTPSEAISMMPLPLPPRKGRSVSGVRVQVEAMKAS